MVANRGDSRAVLCRGKEPMALSVDHNPNRDDEYARIEAAGGNVIQWNGHRVFGVLAMSRSIGLSRHTKIVKPELSFISPMRVSFTTLNDPSVVDQVIQENHVINDKQVEIKRIIPKGSSQSNDFKSKKIFVGGIPTAVEAEEQHEISDAYSVSAVPFFAFIKVEIKRTIPKGSSQSNDFKTKKIFIGGIPTTVSIVLEI
ncbi:hypothetical protein RIF29_10289 [Crotalaria pallida]|uniref:PPM-type phosphatase domain-containing protein n=1 Tax=Crotalaria pallida TaxID=3830 RepID=A0AAN9FVV0_CROPI